MQLVTYDDADGFLRDVQPELETREAEHNLMLGLALSLRDDPAAADHPAFFATIRDAQGWVAAALMTPPHPLVLSTTRDDPGAALQLVAENLRSTDHTVSGVVAPPALSAAFAAQWRRTSGQAAHPRMQQRLYKLREVADVPRSRGQLRLATGEDLELVSRWIAEFDAEAIGEMAPDRARQAAERRIGRQEIYLWEDAEPRTMAARARPTRHAVAINGVYTPPKWRRQGLATAAVARLSEEILREGYSMCVLFTDLANPASNSIYMRIGYQPVCDFTLFRFEPPNATA